MLIALIILGALFPFMVAAAFFWYTGAKSDREMVAADVKFAAAMREVYSNLAKASRSASNSLRYLRTQIAQATKDTDK